MKAKQIPEQQFFDDPALDRIFGVVMALATEVYVLRDRQRALEQMLAERGTIDLDNLNNELTDEERASNQIDLDEFVKHLMVNLTGLQISKGVG